jgi:hypothetical protein
MKTETLGRFVWRLILKILLIEMGLFALIALICWIGGWRTLSNYGTGLMYGGIGAIVLGGLSALGGNTVARDPTYWYVQSVSQSSLNQRTRQNWLDNLASISFLVMMGVVGLIATSVGFMIISIVP